MGARAVGWLALAMSCWVVAGCHDTATRTAEVDVAFDPPLLAFGPTAIGTTRTRELVLMNRGRLTASVRQLRATDASVKVLETGPFELGPGAQRRIRVDFAPQHEGEMSGRIELQDAEAASPLAVRMDGLGVRPRVVPETQQLDFGAIEVGASAVRTLVLRNPTPAEAELQLHLLSREPDIFDVKTEPILLAAGEQRVLTVAFHPAHVGAAAAALSLMPCGGCDPELVQLSGTGVVSGLEVTPTNVDFARIAVGGRAERNIRVTNRGMTTLQFVSAASVQGVKAFELSAPPARSLAPGEWFELQVRFAPTENGASYVDRIHLDLRGLTRHPRGVSVAVSGEGGSSCLLVSPRRLDFGMVAEGLSVPRKVEVHNRCVHEVAVVETRLATQHGGTFSLGPVPATRVAVPAGAKVPIEVVYAPAAGVGASEGELVLVSDEGGNRPTDRIPLTGEGRAFSPCTYRVTPETLDFGRVNVGSTVMLGVALENRGTTPCFLSGMQLRLGTDAAYSADTVPAMAIDPGERAVLPVYFRAESAGTFVGTAEAHVSRHGLEVVTVPLRAETVDSCLMLEPSRVDFGVAKVGCEAQSRPLWVKNGCQSPVQLETPALADFTSPQSELRLTPGLPASRTLAPGERAELRVSYAPVDDGGDLASLRVQATPGGSLTAGVIGRGSLRGSKTDVHQQRLQDKVDVLFVIDNSGSMMEEQQSLARNFAALLSAAQAQYVDYQIGVTTTGLTPSPGGWSTCPGGLDGGENGRLYPVVGGGPRIITPLTPNASEVFARNVQVGWCHWNEQGLEAAYRALSPPLVTSADAPDSELPDDGNLGMLRADAKLSIVFLTDEEDFSPQELGFYETFFRALKRDPRDVTISAIAGPEDLTQCPTASSVGTRYIALARATGGVVENICTQNWAASLQNLSNNAFGPNRRFALSGLPEDPGSIQVEVDGLGVTSGWHYEAASQSIVFDALPPPPGSIIRITYPMGC